jgi:hypothetical protein
MNVLYLAAILDLHSKRDCWMEVQEKIRKNWLKKL